MNEPAAFFSYVRRDDEHENGNLTEIRRRLAIEIEMQTGEEFLIFQDREDILWGQRWQSRIERSIDGTTLLIPVITPAFLRSANCRAEVERFLDRERVLARNDLIFPIYYLDASRLSDTDDPVSVELASRQWADWRPLRFESLDQLKPRQMLARLARDIVSALERDDAQFTNPASPAVATGPEEDEEDGFVELVAEAEDAFPLLTDVITAFSDRLTVIGETATAAGEDLEAANRNSRPAGARLERIRRFSEEIRDPADEMTTLAEEYSEQLARVDGGISAIVARVPALTDPEEITAAHELSAVLRDLDRQAGEGLDSLEQFVKIVTQTGRLSRTVRPVFRTITLATKKLVSSREVFNGWSRELDRALDNIEPIVQPGLPTANGQ